MSRRLALREAAHWALRDDDAVFATPPPRAAADIQAVLDDEALTEALGEVAAIGRLSDHEVRAMREQRRRTLSAGLASVLVAVVGLGVWHVGLAPEAPIVEHIETRRGEQRLVQLADGSRLQLDGATSLDVTFSSDARRVQLQRGEAYFDIAHDARRPFVVQAGASRTQVLGTAFTIDIGQRAVKLAVYRGKVRFGAAGGGQKDMVVPAGWRSSFAEGTAVRPTRFDPTQQDWRSAWVDTDDMILSELVAALNRRGGHVISSPPGELADLPLSGRFKLSDPEELLGALGESYGFRVVRKPERLELVADPDAAP
ncbi:FecR domain-containing protein [Novosphingobium sp. RD2P27]|uniref:FecR domain-containing protein n=1 Tax=Novosphingobium kalidii TaxID=3230299 RepID=A0ABV2D5S8_9SPHN